MLSKKQMKWLYIFLAFALVFITLLFTVISVLGVPLWWAFPIKSLSSVGLPTLVVQVSPQTPKNFNDQITVSVTNSSNQMPIEGAEVLVNIEGMSALQPLYTNSTGQATFPYVGKITIVQANIDGIDSTQVAIPAEPASWVSAKLDAYGSAAVGGLVSAFAVWALPKRKSKPKKRNQVRKARKN